MGLLIVGRPYKWSDMTKYRAYIKKHGIKQFINVYNQFKDRSTDVFLWGDEIECIVLNLDHKTCKARIALRASEILDTLQENQDKAESATPGSAWNVTYHPEYGNFMVEVTPGTPYGSFTSDLRMVETNMRLRRCLIQSQLKENEIIVTMSNFPLFGCPDFSYPSYPIPGPVLKSFYVPDQVMSPHPRFAALSGNIRRRRDKKVNIKVPLFIDRHTDLSNKHNVPALDEREELRATNKEIHMDAMGFGMGCCCLQVTFQTRSIAEARHLYDQLAIVSPIMLALSASTPVHRGLLADWDVRWDIISQAVDDRTEAERQLPPMKEGSTRTPALPPSPPSSPRDVPELSPQTQMDSLTLANLPAEQQPTVGVRYDQNNNPDAPHLTKSRYSSIDCYISNDKHYRTEYNDLPFVYDGESYDVLREHGIDELLSKHIASLFIRDPLVVFEGKIEVDDATTTEHFESIQSTNWRSVRFKPPPLDGPIGWRVEFRTLEIQTSDFENAAYTVFITLLSRATSFFDLNFYIPLSKVDQNFDTAHKNDAVRKELFYFRNRVRSCKRNTGEEGEEGTCGGNTTKDTNGNTNTTDTLYNTSSNTSSTSNSTPKPPITPLFRSTLSTARISNLGECSDSEDDLSFTSSNTTTASGKGIASARETGIASATPQQWELDDATEFVPNKPNNCECPSEEYELMTIAQIMCGKCFDTDDMKCYPGLIPIVRAYMQVIDTDAETKAVVDKYLYFLELRAKGKLLTVAQWMRNIITTHPDYKHDSVVSSKMMYDIACIVDLIGKSAIHVYELTAGLDLEILDPNSKPIILLEQSDITNIQNKHKNHTCVYDESIHHHTEPSIKHPIILSKIDFNHPYIQGIIQKYQTICHLNHEQAEIISCIDPTSTTSTLNNSCCPGIIPTTKKPTMSPSSSPSSSSSSSSPSSTQTANVVVPDISAMSLVTDGSVNSSSSISGSIAHPDTTETLPLERTLTSATCKLLSSTTLTKFQAQNQLATPNGALMAGKFDDYVSGQYPGTPVPHTIQQITGTSPANE